MGKRSRRRGDKHDEPATGDVAVAAPEDEQAAGGAPDADDEAPADAGPSTLSSDGRLHQAQLLIEEADHLGHLYRWIVLAGEVPRAQDWLRREDWPHPDDVIHVFGSWDKFLQHAQVPGSKLLARLRVAEEGQRTLGAREHQVERELARVDDLRRQAEAARRGREARVEAGFAPAAGLAGKAETARRRREAAGAGGKEAQARAERLADQLQRAEARAAQAEEHLAERRREAESAAPAADGAPEE